MAEAISSKLDHLCNLVYGFHLHLLFNYKG